MPVTPVTELWLRPSWLASTLPIWGGAMGSATEQWRGILVMMAAINQPEDAWKNAFLLTLFDNGNTKTNVLYWIATRGKPTCDLTHSPPVCEEAEPPSTLAELPSPPLQASTGPHGAASSPIDGSSAGPSPLLWVGGVLAIAVAVPIGRRFLEHLRAVPAASTLPTEAATDAEYHRI